MTDLTFGFMSQREVPKLLHIYGNNFTLAYLDVICKKKQFMN